MLSLRKTVLTVLATASTLLGTSSRSRAQMPGTPVLQNAFANPGITGALDVASLGGASSYAAAGAWKGFLAVSAGATLGATLAYRLGFGGSHGVSLYGSPVYEAVTRGGGAGSANVFRGAVGMDIGITSAIGATLGIEFGGKNDPESGKPSGTAFGAALSYVIGGGR